MEVLLLGTGSADGWPNPFCTCASCESARAAGEIRGQSAALVDEVLLLDCGPDVPRAAERHGRSLAGVRHVLLTHAHPDHTAPAALLWRRWAGCPEPLDLVGPPAVVEACRDWVGPGDPVRFHVVRPGDRTTLGDGYDVRVLRAAHEGEQVGPAVLYDVTAPDGARLLWATDTGPLGAEAVAATAGAAYDLVLLEETMGDAREHRTDHLDLTSFPRVVAGLREVGAVVESTALVAVHLSHRNPPSPELSRRLGVWGARVVPDGTVLDTAGRGREGPAAHRRQPRRVLVVGGARSGKSVEAERRLASEPAVTYVATSRISGEDTDWAARVAAHRARRPVSWTTLEAPDLPEVLRSTPGPLLVDCLSLWLATELDDAGVWDGGPLRVVRDRVDELVAAWRGHAGPVVAVSNEVGSGVVPASESGRLYRDELGRLNALVAAESDEVLLCVAGQVLPLRTPGG